MKVFIINIFGIITLVSCVTRTTNSPALVEINSKDYGNPGLTMRAIELERNAKMSHIRITHEKGGSVGSSMFVCFAFYKIAKARNCEYFVILKEWIDKDGRWVYIGGFTNKKHADIKEEFGKEFADYDEEGEKRELIKASDFDSIFDRKVKAFESCTAPMEKTK